jgi:hypothetical protein
MRIVVEKAKRSSTTLTGNFGAVFSAGDSEFAAGGALSGIGVGLDGQKSGVLLVALRSHQRPHFLFGEQAFTPIHSRTRTFQDSDSTLVDM